MLAIKLSKTQVWKVLVCLGDNDIQVHVLDRTCEDKELQVDEAQNRIELCDAF